MNFERIIVTGDTKRCTIEQTRYIKELYFKIRGFIYLKTGRYPDLMFTENRCKNNEEWLRLYDFERAAHAYPTPWVVDELGAFEPFEERKKTLIISKELPFVDKAVLEFIGYSFIDIIDYPFRISKVYGVHTNIKKKCFRKLSSNYFFLQADLKRAEYALKRRIDIPKNTALICGQIPVDRSLITKEAKIAKLKDYEKEIKDIVSKHDMTIFKPHPDDWERVENTDYMLGLKCIPFTKERFGNYDIYDLLSEPNIKKVFSISSSVSHEAQYFEKEAFRFDNTYNFYLKNYFPIRKEDLLSSRFWKVYL